MEKIEGHMVADASVKTFDSGKSVVNFTLADNDRIPDGKGGFQQITRYFDCSYWVGPAIAAHLTKGRPVVVEGRIGVRAYTNGQAEPVGVLTLRVQRIKFLTAGQPADSSKSRTNFRPVTEDVPF